MLKRQRSRRQSWCCGAGFLATGSGLVYAAHYHTAATQYAWTPAFLVPNSPSHVAPPSTFSQAFQARHDSSLSAADSQRLRAAQQLKSDSRPLNLSPGSLTRSFAPRLAKQPTGVATGTVAAAAGAAGTDASIPAPQTNMSEYLAVLFYIVLWYVFAIGYNIYFKKALIAFPYPWTHALWQIAFGCFIFGPLWATGLRKKPELSGQEAIKLLPSAFGNLVLHVGAIIAFFGGAVSFVHIVKASEPVVSSVLNYIFIGEVLPWQVYASLLPIIGGVSLASAKELSFTWLGFGAAMASNFGAAGRAVYSKKLMGTKIGKNMDAANTFSVLTILGTMMLLPIYIIVEKPVPMYHAFRSALASGGTTFVLHMFVSALFYYLYNELAFLALGKLDPVSHAVVNTMRRVVIIMAAILVFNTKVTMLGGIGSGIAVLGTLLYSLAKSKFKK